MPEGIGACLPGRRAELCPDEALEDLFPSGTGRTSVLAEVIAFAMLLKETHTGGRERRRNGHRQGPVGLARTPQACLDRERAGASA